MARPVQALTCLVAFSLALAGCVGSDGSGEPAEDTLPDAPGPYDPRNATPQNGSTSAPAAAEPLGTVTVAWDGNTGVQACVPSNVNGCSGLGTGGDDSRDLEAPQPEEPADRNRSLQGAFNLTWNAGDPTTETLGLHLAWTEPCGDSCLIFHAVASERGSSPVTLALDNVTVPGNRTLVLSVSAGDDLTPDPLLTMAHTDQSFHVEGNATVWSMPVE